MALRSKITEDVKQTSEWKDYRDEEGNTLARFKVRSFNYRPYQVALDRINRLTAETDSDIKGATQEDKLKHELMFEAMAAHLIADWENVELALDGENYQIVPYSYDNALALLLKGDLGLSVFQFVLKSAHEIHRAEYLRKTELMGKSETSTDGKQPKATNKQQTKKEKSLQDTQSK